MRSFRFGAAVIALLVAGSAYAGVRWMEAPFADAVASANAEGKPVLLDFYATWCGPCKLMDKEVYTDAAVTELSGGFVSLKLDAEKGEGIDLAKRFRIFNYPTVVLLRPDESEIDRVVGYRPAAEFAQILKDYPAGIHTTEDWLRRADLAPDDLEADLDAGEAWAVVAEAIQTVMRRHGLPHPYETLKELTRGRAAGRKTIEQFIESLPLSGEARAALRRLSPRTYVGLASELVERFVAAPKDAPRGRAPARRPPGGHEV